MESDKNIMPKIDFFPRISRVVHFLFDHLHSEGQSSHNKGGGPMLDEMELPDDVIDLRAEIPEETQLMLDYWTCEQ